MIKDRIYLSTTASDAPTLARRYALGLEIAEYCTAWNMDRELASTDSTVREKMASSDRFVFHVCYNELCPAAIDPLVLEITRRRYTQAIELARGYGIRKLVIHSGYIPRVYFKSWFTEQSAAFWRGFLKTFPEDMEICLENVMEDEPYILTELVKQVDDPRFGLCLDIGHASACSTPERVPEWVRVCKPHLHHMHLHDNHGREDEHLPLGQGALPLTRILDETLDTGCTYTIENMTAESSVAWLCGHNYI